MTATSDTKFVHVGAPMAMDNQGRLHVVWYTGKEGGQGIYYAISSDKGKTFSSPTPILTGDGVPPLRSQLVIDGNDNAWIVWEASSGLSANAEKWKYEDTRAMIYAAVVTPDGDVFKKQQPINQVDGRSPVMASGADSIAIVWADNKNEIQCSMLLPAS